MQESISPRLSNIFGLISDAIGNNKRKEMGEKSMVGEKEVL